jgi:hypothetical protein
MGNRAIGMLINMRNGKQFVLKNYKSIEVQVLKKVGFGKKDGLATFICESRDGEVVELEMKFLTKDVKISIHIVY